jgi:glycosyltransferase involved in cell wall biosynthesis
MFTNVFRPKVGGVTRSVETFTERFIQRGHEVLIIAPSFEGATENEPGVMRVPAMHDVLHDYSLPMAYPGMLQELVAEHPPDIIHAHHPFFLGTSAHKVAATLNIPIVYTHHTRFDAYGPYFPRENGFLQNFVVALAIQFANVCDAVVAPGAFVRDMLREGGVAAPIHVIPTGVNVPRFASGDGAAIRKRFGIPADAPVVGYLGRISAEKNLDFLAKAVTRLLQQLPSARFLVAGGGPYEDALREHFEAAGLEGRVHATGMLAGQDLVDAYHAMNVFAFASRSETQGMVVTEALAAGVPVVALEASGVEDVLEDNRQGRLLAEQDEQAFAAALAEVLAMDEETRRMLSAECRATAEAWSIERCADEMLSLYADLIAQHPRSPTREADFISTWDAFGRRVHDELELWKTTTAAFQDALYKMINE